MKTTILAALTFSVLAVQANAAVLKLRNEVSASTPGADNTVLEEESYDTETDGTLQYFSTETDTSSNGVRSRSFSGVDTSEGIGRAIAHIQKDANTGDTSSSATARNIFRENYRVHGTGKAEVDFTVYGDFTTLTDAPDLMSVGAYGHILITHPDRSFLEYLNTQNPGDPLLGLSQGPFHRTFSFLFDVTDGETFSILTQIQATAEFEPFQSAFFDIEVDVKSGLRVRGQDGASIVPGDGTLINPVPLPASAFFLMTPLAALTALRRRRKRVPA